MCLCAHKSTQLSSQMNNNQMNFIKHKLLLSNCLKSILWVIKRESRSKNEDSSRVTQRDIRVSNVLMLSLVHYLSLGGAWTLMLADRLEVKCGQDALREVPRESWWPHKPWPNRALLAPWRNTASYCAELKKRISVSEKAFPSATPGQQVKLCLIIQSLSMLCRADLHNLSQSFLLSFLPFSALVSSIR